MALTPHHGAAVIPHAGTKMTTLKADARQLVQSLRERTGLTQEKFAARLGVTFPTINRWENGHAKPSPLALKQIEL